MANYKKKPVIIQAVQFRDDNEAELLQHLENCIGWHIDNGIKIPTLEGIMTANKYDWIIKGINGEFYPCKPDIFDNSYELVSE